MYCPEKLKLNKFKLVRIPKGIELFGRIGQIEADPSRYTGDGEALPFQQSKIDAIAEADAEYNKYLNKEE